MTGGFSIPALDLTGDPCARGNEHGRALAARIRDNLETYLKRFEASGLAREAALKEGEAWDATIARTSPDYAAEMRAVADGADLPRGAIALLNARYEIAFTLFGRDARAPDGPAAEPDGCTSAGILPEASADGATYLIQNWDWLAALRGGCAIMRVRRTDGPDMIFLTEAGIVGGKMGLNEHGIGLVENGLACEGDGRHPYEKPFHVRCREVLDAATLNDAMLPIVQTRRVCSANYVIGDAAGEIVDLETSPDLVTALHPQDGLLTHSNHFLDPRHGASQMERLSPNTLFRAARTARLLGQEAGNLTLEHFGRTFSDHLSHPNAVCRHPDPRQPAAKRTMTLASVVLDLTRRRMWVAEGPPCEHAYACFALEGPLASAA